MDPDDPDDPDEWRDEAEDEETCDNERDDHEDVPVVDASCRTPADRRSYGYRFGDFIGE